MKPTREETEPYMKKANGIIFTILTKMKWNPYDYHLITYDFISTINVELIHAWAKKHDKKIG